MEMSKVSDPSNCEACDGRGWLAITNDVHGFRIERCDACERFPGDRSAIEHCVDMTVKAEEAGL